MENPSLLLIFGGIMINLLIACLVTSLLLNIYIYQLYADQREQVKALSFWNDVFHGTLEKLLNEKGIYKP